MYSSSVNKEVIKQKIQDDLNENSGVNNTSKSSVVTHIIDSVSGPISENINIVNSAINSVYTNLATGSMLTANAYDFGVIRSLYSDTYIKDTDGVVMIRMENNSLFPDYFSGVPIVHSGQRVSINDSIVIEFTKDLYLNPGDSNSFASVKISTDSGTDFSKGSTVSLSDINGSLTNGLLIEFTESVNFKLHEESDESLRRRANAAKLRVHGSSEYSISQWVENTPEVSEYMLEYLPSRNSYNIYVVTNRLKERFTDPAIANIISSIRYKLDSYTGAEVKYEIHQPDLYKVYFSYKYRDLTNDLCDSIIGKAFNNLYVYGGGSSLSLNLLRSEVAKYTDDIFLDGVIIYNESLNQHIQEEDGVLNTPPSILLAYDKTMNLSLLDEDDE